MIEDSVTLWDTCEHFIHFYLHPYDKKQLRFKWRLSLQGCVDLPYH